MDLWAQTRDYFTKNDGSLPEIVFRALSPEQTRRMFAVLQARSKAVTGMMWIEASAVDTEIASVLDPVQVVLEENSHLCAGLEDTRVGSILLPPLNTFVFPDSVSVYFRMGPEWGSPEIAAFFDLLFELSRCAPQCEIATEEWCMRHEDFMSVWTSYLHTRLNELKD